MPHPLITHLRFARHEFRRGLRNISDEDARRRFEPMNCISWIIGHLANQENYYWVRVSQDIKLQPGLQDLVGYGKPASTPPVDEMWAAWKEITAAADTYLDTLTAEMLSAPLMFKGRPQDESVGQKIQRNIYHYWYHLGEAMSIRQMLGHTDLPEFVGKIPSFEHG